MLLGAMLVLCAPTAPARALVVGMSDQQTDSWPDPRLRALGLRHARLIVPWDAARSEPERVQAWLDAVAAQGFTPHVAFQHRRGEDCRTTSCRAPSRSEYRDAVAAFLARFPQVTTYTTWNEANHRAQPVVNLPERVAGYYEDLRELCRKCTVVAGDVLDSGGYVTWLRRFLAASDTAPRLWGLHNYGDVTYGRTTGTDRVLATVPGSLWVEETGGIVTLRSGGRETLRTDESRARDAIDRAFAIAADRPRITRMYVYHWRGGFGDSFDAGLIRPDGSTRPSYGALAGNLAELRSRTGPAVPGTRGRWSKLRPAQLLLRLACRSSDGVCSGRVRVTAATRSRSGSREHRKLITTRTYTSRSTKRVVLLRITVPASLRRRVRNAAKRALVVTVRPAKPRGSRKVLRRRLTRPR